MQSKRIPRLSISEQWAGSSSTIPVVVHDIGVEQPQNVALILASPVPVCVHVCHGGRVIMEVLATGLATPYAVLRAAVGMAASSLPGPLVASTFGAEPVVELGVLLGRLSSASGRHGVRRARECTRRIDATRSRHGQGMEELASGLLFERQEDAIRRLAPCLPIKQTCDVVRSPVFLARGRRQERD